MEKKVNRRTMKQMSLVLVGFVYPCVSSACIWQNGDAPYWPSNTIEVCFNAPSATELRDSIAAFNSARIQVRAAYDNLSLQSPISFVGFQTCTDEGNSSRTPKIRIDLAQDSGIPAAGSIGPSSSTNATNIVVPYMVTVKSGNSSAPQPVNPHNLGFAIQHETLHLLGFRHDCRRDDAKYFSQLNRTVEVGAFDATSVMTITEDETNRMTQNREVLRQPPFLSDGDRACLRLLATRQISGPSATSTALPESAH